MFQEKTNQITAKWHFIKCFLHHCLIKVLSGNVPVCKCILQLLIRFGELAVTIFRMMCFPMKAKESVAMLGRCLPNDQESRDKRNDFFFKEAYPNLNLFTCLEATSSKRNLKPDHSASVTGFRFCGFMMSVFKTLSVDSFRFLEGQQPCYKSLVRGRPVLSFSTYFISWKKGSNFWETRKPLFWFYIVEQPRRSSNLPKIKWQGGKCSTVQHKQYAMA